MLEWQVLAASAKPLTLCSCGALQLMLTVVLLPAGTDTFQSM